MENGDIIEWQGLNRKHKGKVIKDHLGRLLVDMGNGHQFRVEDVRAAQYEVISKGGLYESKSDGR